MGHSGTRDMKSFSEIREKFVEPRVKTHWFNGLHFSLESETRVKNFTPRAVMFEIVFESSFRVISLKSASEGPKSRS